ncbi:hypothetical protein ABIF90_007165 [Bradyrhizobium japonicum]
MLPSAALASYLDGRSTTEPPDGDGQHFIGATGRAVAFLGKDCGDLIVWDAVAGERQRALPHLRASCQSGDGLTLIFTSSSVTAPPRQTILARARSCSPRSSTTFSMRHRNKALRCASETVSSPHICARRPVRLMTLSLSSLLMATCVMALDGVCRASASSAARKSFSAASHRRSSSEATSRLSGSARLNCRSASAAVYRLLSSSRSALERNALFICCWTRRERDKASSSTGARSGMRCQRLHSKSSSAGLAPDCPALPIQIVAL